MLVRVSTCRVCGNKSLTDFFDVGEQPFANALLKSPSDPDPTYPLALTFCNDCSLVQLTHKAEQEELFSHYVWVTGTSKKTLEFANVFCNELLKRADSPKDTYVLEIASNDGTFLKPFRSLGFEVLGIDPAKNIAEMANRDGIPTEALFWGADTARDVVRKRGTSKIVFARNVLPHVSDQRDFVEGLSIALAPDGVIAIEVHYAAVILQELHYDSIYHEHHCYFSLKSLEHLLNEYGLFLFDIAKSPISGGSIIVYAKKVKAPDQTALTRYRAEEEKSGVNTLEMWQEFGKRAHVHRTNFQSLLQECASAGVTLGYGASARASTLLNFCNVSNRLLPAIADKNPLKQGLCTAGTHIPIVTIDALLEQHPKTIAVLAWNFKDEIVDELRSLGYRGKFLLPFPDLPYIL